MRAIVNTVFIMIILLCCTNSVTAQNTAIIFKNKAGDKELQLFEETYYNGFGEPFIVSKFKYYISDLSVTMTNNKVVSFAGNYYLIDEADAASKKIELPVTDIKAIAFTIGVDSARNISGVQTGSLDPMNGMFWTWNSGYVFAKLEGKSDSSHAPAHNFTWDVGGFRSQQNALRKINLSLDGHSSNSIVITADILQWFNAVQPLKITVSPICHQPGKLAMQIADNYSHMFSIAQ